MLQDQETCFLHLSLSSMMGVTLGSYEEITFKWLSFDLQFYCQIQQVLFLPPVLRLKHHAQDLSTKLMDWLLTPIMIST